MYTQNELLAVEPTRPPRKLVYTLTTDHHFDHASGNAELKHLYPDVEIIREPLHLQTLVVGNNREFVIKCIRTPCHTRDSVCYNVNEEYLLTGDAFFKLGCGKFFEGGANDFNNSVNNIYQNCNDDIVLLYGHDYFKTDFAFAKIHLSYTPSETEYLINTPFLTLGDEKRHNPFLLVKDVPERLQQLRIEKNNFTA